MRRLLKPIVLSIALICAAGVPRIALSDPTTAPALGDEKYESMISKRADDIVSALNISDAAKAKDVHDVLAEQYRTLRDWHDANDAKIKNKEDADAVEASRKQMHDAFIARLNALLTPEQVDTVKDKMSNGYVQASIKGYDDIVGSSLPNGFTDDQRAMIKKMMYEAREEAMDGGSAKEKAAIIKKWRGRVNIELTKQGIDVSKAYKDWGDKQKAKKNAATTESSTDDKQ